MMKKNNKNKKNNFIIYNRTFCLIFFLLIFISNSVFADSSHINTTGNITGYQLYEGSERVCTAANGFCSSSIAYQSNAAGWTNDSVNTTTNLNVVIGAGKNLSSPEICLAGSCRTSWPTEADTLATVTARGATTTSAVTIDSDGDEQTNIGGSLYVNGSALGARVGIGTTSPGKRLQLGTTTSTSTATPETISLGGTYSNTAGLNPKLIIYNSATVETGLGVSSAQMDYILGSTSYDHVFYSTSANELMRIDGSTGNVGIGSTSPSQKLHVAGNVNITSNLSIGTGTQYFEIYSDATNVILNSTSKNMQLSAGSGNLFINRTNGNVGIGTTSPEFGLHIKGTYPKGYLIVERNNTNGLGPAGMVVFKTDGKTIGDGQIISIHGLDSANNDQSYGQIRTEIVNSTSTNEASKLHFWNMKAGTITQQMIITNDGNVGIGTTSPSQKLDVNGNVNATTYYGAGTGLTGTAASLTVGDLSCTDCIGTTEIADSYLLNTGDAASGNYTFDTSTLHIDSTNNRVGIGDATPSYTLEVNGNVSAIAFYYSSDERLKKDVKTIENPIDKIKDLRGVSFKWKENDQKSIGLIAQEVEKIIPELISQGGEGYKSVQYGNVVALLIESTKEQQKMIEEQKLITEKQQEMIANQQKQIDNLKRELDGIKEKN
jgi:hypothetical protein